MDPAVTSRRVSNSELKTFKRCRRKWWLGQHRGLRPRSQGVVGPRELGTKIHDVLGEYYSPANTDVTTPEDVLALYDKQLGVDLERVQAKAAAVGLDGDAAGELAVSKQHDLGRAMLEGYFEWLEEEGADGDWEVVSAEREVEVPLAGYDGPRPVILVGKLDVAVRLRSSGAKRFVDHKSVMSIGDLPAIADIDEQFWHYSLLDFLTHLAAGDDAEGFVDGGVFNMLRKVKRTKTATPPFYARHEVRHNVDELRSYWMRMVGEMKDVQAVEDRLAAGEDHRFVVYPNPTRDCSWDCDFRSLCPMLDDPRTDAEGFIAEAYETADPYARYTGQKTEETK